MILEIFTDGGAKGNPGPASIGVVCYGGKRTVFTHKASIGIATNNVAEYSAVIQALRLVQEHIRDKKLVVEKILFYSDSELMVHQINGVYRVKNARLGELLGQVRTLQGELGIPITFTHVTREKNTVADSLVNDVFKH